MIGEWFDLSDGELRRRLLQRDLDPTLVEWLLDRREDPDGIDKIDSILTGRNTE